MSHHIAQAAEASRPTLADSAHRELKRRIVTVELEPGAQIRETDVVDDLGVGKTPVRSALLRLSVEGLVQVQSRSGYRVTPVTLKSVKDTCGLRALLEGATAFQAASTPVASARELLAISNEERETPVAAGDDELEALSAWLDVEGRFHLSVAQAAGNALLTKTLADVFDGFSRLCHFARVLGGGTAFKDHAHQPIVDAIAAGEPGAARSLAIADVEEAEAAIVKAVLASDSILTANVDATPASSSNTFYLNVPPSY